MLRSLLIPTISFPPFLCHVLLFFFFFQLLNVLQRHSALKVHTFHLQLTADARCRLVSWLIPVHKYFHLSFECCCLAVNIMDRFLTSTPVAADCFQLLGLVCITEWFCVVQVEVCSPRISQLLSLCCDAFTKEQLCNLECLILLRLNFCLAAPTLAFFLDYYTNCIERKNPDIKRSKDRSFLAQKMCELSLADYAFNKYPPSLTASCALTLANELLKTTQGSVPQASIQSQGEQWDAFMDELYESNTSTADSVPSQIPDIAHLVYLFIWNIALKPNNKMIYIKRKESIRKGAG
uniref:Cyclin O n=1 Tax=Sphaeramia orbicularis TaxID=375764 RepID=A0A672ZFB2_9TELE